MPDVSKFIADIKNSSGYWEEIALMDFAIMLSEEMTNQGISKSQLAEKTGVSKAYISRVLGGERANFTLRSMAKFLFALGKRLCLHCEPIKQKASITCNDIYSWFTMPQKQVGSQVSFEYHSLKDKEFPSENEIAA